MSGILNIVLILGLVGGGIWFAMNRCTLIPEICQPAAGAPAATAPTASVTETTATIASKDDNGKSKKCGCCNCKQNNEKEIVCTTATKSITYSGGGLNLADQCEACSNDKDTCKAEKDAAKQQANNDKVTKSGSVRCADGSSLKNGVCVRNDSKPKSTPKPNLVVDGCPKGTFRDCQVVKGSNIIPCKCSKSKVQYARAMYSSTPARVYYGGVPSQSFVSVQYDTYRPFRNRISFK